MMRLSIWSTEEALVEQIQHRARACIQPLRVCFQTEAFEGLST